MLQQFTSFQSDMYHFNKYLYKIEIDNSVIPGPHGTYKSQQVILETTFKINVSAIYIFI